MRNARHSALLSVLALCSIFLGSVSAEEIRLGGIRDAVAEITTHGENLECKVSFIPVRAFDKPLNAGINRSKAKFYCRRALMIWSKIPNGSTATFSGLRPIGSENGGERYSHAFTIPKDGIKEDSRAKAKSASAATERKEIEKTETSVTKGVSLLAREDDHMSTIHSLAMEFRSTLSSQPQFPTNDDLDVATADLEQQIRDAIEASRKDVNSDRLLLGIEKSRISAHLNQLQEELIQELALLHQKNSKNN